MVAKQDPSNPNAYDEPERCRTDAFCEYKAWMLSLEAEVRTVVSRVSQRPRARCGCLEPWRVPASHCGIATRPALSTSSTKG